MNDQNTSTAETKGCYEVIAGQIDREDALTNYRLTWTLTLNGFLFAALGFLGSKESPDPGIAGFLHWALPLTGILVSVAGLLGVIGAFIQIVYLTRRWEELNDKQWPRPFGDKGHAFLLGAAPCFLPTVTLIVVWAGIYFAWQ